MTNEIAEGEDGAGTGTEPERGARVNMQEGSVEMPATYEDRSTHLFVPADPQREPNLSIARDWLREDEALGAYVERQLAQLKSRLPGHKLLARAAEKLGAGDAALEGERVEAQYRNGQQTIRQRQAVFLVAPGRALIFTASSPRPFDDAAERLWRDWLGSYRRAGPTVPQDAAETGGQADDHGDGTPSGIGSPPAPPPAAQ